MPDGKTKMTHRLHIGDCLDVLKELDDNSIDSIVTDPPYGLSFMGKRWDYDVPSVAVWCECLRVLKPGGHLLSFSSARTYHRMVVNIEDAGFEVRDQIMWVYGSGFPKSLNIGKQIGESSDRSKQWEGWGTALKPAHEPIVMARKPLSEKTIAKNVLKWGTGGINIDKCRVGSEKLPEQKAGQAQIGTFKRTDMVTPERTGRFPANFSHDGSDEVVGLFPDTKPSKSGGVTSRTGNGAKYGMGTAPRTGHNDQGTAARFFYCPKANKKERNAGCEKLDKKRRAGLAGSDRDGNLDDVSERWRTQPAQNNHPTVKPVELMKYLCRLITPKGGTVLDPFMGSGTTGIAAKLEGFGFVGIELDADYLEIAKARIDAHNPTFPPLGIW